MATLGDRILEAIRSAPLDDDTLARRLGVSHRQAVNQAARRLEARGLVRRISGPDGKIVNALPARGVPERSLSSQPSTEVDLATPQRTSDGTPVSMRSVDGRITEDEVKEAVRLHLADAGFVVQVAWGRAPGIDIAAHHADGRRYVIEAKAEVRSAVAQQHNYFVGMLGELVQRMDDPEATYGIALPRNRQYHGLVERLPALAKSRLGLVVFWVDRANGGLVVTQECGTDRTDEDDSR